MSGITFSVPSTPIEDTQMESFTNDTKGIQGIRPIGWTEAGPAAYTRGSSALDETALIMDAAQSTARELLERLAGNMGFDPSLESSTRQEIGNFAWDFYSLEYQGLIIDLALAENEGRAYMVLLAAEPEDHDVLYKQVFLSAVEALAPLE
jgi:hypothetical protein